MKPNSSPDRISRKIADTLGTLVELEDAYRLAHRDTVRPSPRRSRRPTDTTRRSVGTHSDPTGTDVALHAARLDDVAAQVDDLHRRARRALSDLDDWRDPLSAPAPAKRCGEDDCLRPVHGRGLCQRHYRADYRDRQRQDGAA